MCTEHTFFFTYYTCTFSIRSSISKLKFSFRRLFDSTATDVHSMYCCLFANLLNELIEKLNVQSEMIKLNCFIKSVLRWHSAVSQGYYCKGSTKLLDIIW